MSEKMENVVQGWFRENRAALEQEKRVIEKDGIPGADVSWLNSQRPAGGVYPK